MTIIHINAQQEQQHSASTATTLPAHLDNNSTAMRSKRKVSFSSMDIAHSIDCQMTPHEIANAHCTGEELRRISLRAGSLASSHSSTSREDGAAPMGVLRLDADPSLRGLERTLCPARKANRSIVRRGLLEYRNALESKRNKSEEEKSMMLAAASRKLSRWSNLVARETARLDSMRAYGGDYLIPIEAPVDITSRSLLTTTKNKEASKNAKKVSKKCRRTSVDVAGRPVKRRRAQMVSQ